MSYSSSHKTKQSRRWMIAIAMAVIYLVISLSPLAPLAIYSKVVAHAVTGECSGDCDICGCSLESRANHTCCCAKKRQQQAHIHEDGEDGTADCCRKIPAKKKTIIACGCPCGSGKQAVLAASGISEVLPFHFTEQFTTPHTETTFTNLTQRLTSCFYDPPDPPPKLSTRS
jgi:hypothetical protein